MSSVLNAFGDAALGATDFISIIPQGQIDSISIDATIQETHHEQVDVTDHPVEIGALIADHSFSRPSEVVMRCGWSNSNPVALIGDVANIVTSIVDDSFSSTADYIGNVYNQLRALMKERKPITIVTTLRQYTNMLLTGLQVMRDEKTSQALILTANFRQIITVQTATSLSSTPPVSTVPLLPQPGTTIKYLPRQPGDSAGYDTFGAIP